MTIATFPSALNGKADSKTVDIEREDPSLKTPLEGGYASSRAKHTRKPRRKINFTFTELSSADWNTLDDFIANTVHVSAVAFNWITPWTYGAANETIVVRFTGPPKATYVGIGAGQRWTVTCQVEEV